MHTNKDIFSVLTSNKPKLHRKHVCAEKNDNDLNTQCRLLYSIWLNWIDYGCSVNKTHFFCPKLSHTKAMQVY